MEGISKMNEYTENAPEKIDLIELLDNVLKGIKKLWWVILGLTVVFALKAYFNVSYSYVPRYVASATASIRSSGSSNYIDQTTAEQMADIFPYIVRSGVFEDAILDDMGLDAMPGSISMTVENGTNFFTISANAADPQVAYDLLQATIRQYPKVAEFAVGRIQMTVLDETGIPKNTGRESVFRGSVRNGAIKGFAMGCILLALYVVLTNKIKKEKDIRKVVNLENLGSVPAVQAKRRKKRKSEVTLVMHKEGVPQMYEEAIRKVRYRVMKEMESNGYRSLLITSSIPGEGKTTLAANLAIALARQGKKVVLIDADMKNPSLAKVLNETEEHPGLAAVLRMDVSIGEALTTIAVNGGKLRVMFASQPDAEGAKLLSLDEMGKLVKTLEQSADIVILDTAPSGVMADAAVLGNYVGAALYVVRYDFINRWKLRTGVQLLAESNAKILGYILNADKSRGSKGYGYGYGYKNYSGYYGYGRYDSRKKDDMSGRVMKD